MRIAIPKLKWLAAVIGGGLTFAAVTNSCAMAKNLAKLPYNRGGSASASGIQTVLTALRGDD